MRFAVALVVAAWLCAPPASAGICDYFKKGYALTIKAGPGETADVFAPVTGKPASQQNVPNATVYTLASGYDTQIYRVVLKGGGAYIKKIYGTSQKALHEFGGYARLSAMLTKVKNAPFATQTASVPPEQAGDIANLKALNLTDVQGRGLQDVLADTRIDADTRDQLLKNYLARLTELDKLITKTGLVNVTRDTGLTNEDPGYSYTDPRQPQNLALSIRISQVVVSFTPGANNSYTVQMTLIDPY